MRPPAAAYLNGSPSPALIALPSIIGRRQPKAAQRGRLFQPATLQAAAHRLPQSFVQRLIAEASRICSLHVKLDPQIVPIDRFFVTVSVVQDRTTFVIAHRLSTIRQATEILVIEQGRIVERGTHAELIAKEGRYYELYTYQARI